MIRNQISLKGIRYISNARPKLMTFEGNTKGVLGTEEERLKSVFGGRLKGEPPTSTSRFLKDTNSRKIAGVVVPSRPHEPDNCCMSGCVNCVWELYNDDLKEWKVKRKEAAKAIASTNEVWPEDFNPPLKDLNKKNIPKSLYKKKEKLDSMKKQTSGSFFPKRTTPLPQTVIEAKKRNAMKRSGSRISSTKDADLEVSDMDDSEGWENVPVFFKAFAEFEKKKNLRKQAATSNSSAPTPSD